MSETMIARHVTDLTVSECAAVIAAMLLKAEQALIPNHSFAGKALADLDHMAQRRYRGLAELAIMKLDPLTVNRAEARTREWVGKRLAHSYGDDFPEWPTIVIDDACQSTLDEIDHQLARAWRERA